MDFGQAEDKFRQLKAQFESGELTETDFKTQLEELMVQDEGGNWWMIGYETERWYRHDGTNWVQADPTENILQKSTPVITPESETIEGISAEKVAGEKATHEQAKQKVERKTEIITSPEEAKNEIVGEKITADTKKRVIPADQNLFLEVKQRLAENLTWRFGKREILTTIIGLILLNIVSLFFVKNRSPLFILFYGSHYGTYFDPRTAILLFFSLLFGPIVGFVVGLLGSSIGSFPLSGLTRFSYFYIYASYGRAWLPLLIWFLRGLMGFIIGLAKTRISNLISNRGFFRTGLFVLFAFIPGILISILSSLGTLIPPNYPLSRTINLWFRSPNNIENIVIELVFTFIYLSIFMYVYFKISKFVPGTLLPDDSKTENTPQENAELKANENIVGLTEPKIRKSSTANNRLLNTWWGRSLLGGILGVILWFAYAGFSSYSSGGEIIIFVVVCSLAGLITYPHKLSIVFLLLGFLVAGFIAEPDLTYPEDFIAAGGILGIPAGTLLSRILHWIKVLK